MIFNFIDKSYYVESTHKIESRYQKSHHEY